jgi:hypothetical protein
MLSDLFYEFDRIKLKRNGTVVFWRNKWKFWDKETVHASELVIKEIPQRIERATIRRSSQLRRYWEPTIQKEVLKIINGEDFRDVTEYLWTEYIKIKFPIHKMKPSPAIIAGEESLKHAFVKHCNSLIRSPRINIDDILSQIKKAHKKPIKKVTKLNLKRILNTEYFSFRQLIAA